MDISEFDAMFCRLLKCVLKNMADQLEEQITIMPLIATATEVKKDSCIFVSGLLVTVRCLLLLSGLSTASDK